MDEMMLLGRGEHIFSVSTAPLSEHLAAARAHSATRLAFMTGEHHRVRNFVVRELPRNAGKPLRPEDIARRLALPLDKVVAVLAELQQHLFFLVLDDAGAVSWAFPVTVERTPHRLRFSSGEEIWAA
jgi:hypothetical protein